MVDAFVRPVFQNPRIPADPRFFTFIDTPYVVGGTTPITHNIRPSAGEKWSVNYIQILCTVRSNGTAAGNPIYINLVDVAAGNTVTLKQDISVETGDSISFGSFGNGPLLLTNNFYIQTSVANDANGQANTFHIAASVTEV